MENEEDGKGHPQVKGGGVNWEIGIGPSTINAVDKTDNS